MPEHEPHSEHYLNEPLRLHERVVLTNDDIETELQPNNPLYKTVLRKTLMWLSKDGFPTYAMEPHFQTGQGTIPLAVIMFETSIRAFVLKDSSPAVQSYIDYRKSKQE